jgi:photosystem II stability/assembly factor-like uncharacterized protein
MEWRNIGPFRGGRSDAVAGVPSQPRLYYFGGVGGGVWKTENAGETWANITDGQLKTSSVGAIAVALSDPNVLYVGMGENDARGVAISFGDGVYKSTDAGRTWKHLGLDLTRAISRIRIHPNNPDLVYVAAQGATFGATRDRGVFRSKDGGVTWTNVLFVNETSGPSDLAMDPVNPRILYAAFWDHLRKPWEVRSGGPGSGLYKSTDAGDTWQKINEGLPALMGKIGVDVSAANPDRLYAVVEADPKGGLYRSDNAGKSWTLLNDTDWALKTRSWYYMKVFADTRNPDVVWVLNADVSKSIDGGKTFTKVVVPHGDNHDLWINPRDPDNMVEANDGGANVTFDGGRSWSTQENQPTAQFYRVNTDDRFPYWVYGGQQDNTSVGIASRASGSGIGWKDWYPVGGCESAYVDFDPANPELLYAGCYHGVITEFDRATMDARDVMEYPSMNLALPSREMKYRYNWNAPIVVSKHDPKVIYHASQILSRSDNRGRTWKEISPDLTHPDDKTQGYGGGPITNEGAGGEVYDTIYYVAESPKDKNTLWTGSDDGVLNLTRDGGKSWNKVALPGVADAQINAIEVSPHDPGTVYVAATRYKWNDMAPYIFKSVDYGKTWQKLVEGIPSESWAHVVREDPVRKDLLYAGTENGIFVSFDGGRKWQTLQLNLPVTPVNDLQVHRGGDLVAATSGRAFWILDDLSPLRQAAESITAEPVHLFQPRPAIRSSLGGSATPGLPPAPRLGKNPPNGAILDFFLAKEGPVTLEILDSSGNLVRTYSTEKKEGQANPSLKVKAGMNRTNWDLRYDAPAMIPGVFLFGGTSGRKAIPGTYQARLTASGQTKTAALEVRDDPRLKVTLQQYAEVAKLQSQVMGDFDDLHKSVIRLRQVRTQIEDVLKRSDDKSVEGAGKALVEKLTAEEDALIQKRTVDMQTVINFPVRLNHHLLVLANNVDEGGELTDGARKRASDLDKQWQEHKATLAGLLGPQLEAFNKQAAAAKTPYVTVPK